MAEERVPRRLAAIVATDVVGYSRMMGHDEAGTLANLKALREEILDPKVGEYLGRVVKTTGDGMLVEFGSAVDAVAYSIDIQHGMAERNADAPESAQIWLRVGINVGDVILDGEDIYGDGVNVAARLEALAEPGGICISGRVHDYIGDRIDIAAEDLGPQALKNISEPVQVYRVRLMDAAITPPVDHQGPLPLPSKPSIAVLPFTNMSGDPDQEYFSDGISEDIITALSKFRWFFVIARNSSFTYKQRAVDVKQVSRELGVQYILEGSVRKAGERVRISAQLIDATTGVHIWAERFDRALEDVFELQDEITSAVTAAVEPELASAERSRATSKRSDDMGAWDLYQRAMWHLWRWNDEDAERAYELFRQVIEMDPDHCPAHAGIAYLLYLSVLLGRSEAPGETLAEALPFAQRAVEIDEQDAFAHFALGRIYTMKGHTEPALTEIQKALQLNPNFAHASYALGFLLVWCDRSAEALPHLDRVMRQSPNDPLVWGFELVKAWALQSLGQLEEAEELFNRACLHPTKLFWPYTGKAALMASLDRINEAQDAIEIALARQPRLTTGVLDRSLPAIQSDTKKQLLANLRKAGLPE